MLSFCDKMLTQARSCGFDSRPVPKPFRLGILMIRLYVLALVFSAVVGTNRQGGDAIGRKRDLDFGPDWQCAKRGRGPV